MIPILLALLSGCNDYKLLRREDPNAGGEDTGTAPVDTGEPPVEPATEPLYLNSGTTLYTWTPGDAAPVAVGEFRVNGEALTQVTDTAVDLDGNLYAVSDTWLFQVDPATAEAWQVAALDEPLMGLTCLADGRLVGAGESVVILDPQGNGRSTVVQAGAYTTSGDIIGLPDGLLYWTVENPDDYEAGDLLVSVDPATGRTEVRGVTGYPEIFGLGWADNHLFGFTSDGRAIRISTTTAIVYDDVELSGSWWGATTNPVLW